MTATLSSLSLGDVLLQVSEECLTLSVWRSDLRPDVRPPPHVWFRSEDLREPGVLSDVLGKLRRRGCSGSEGTGGLGPRITAEDLAVLPHDSRDMCLPCALPRTPSRDDLVVSA